MQLQALSQRSSGRPNRIDDRDLNMLETSRAETSETSKPAVGASRPLGLALETDHLCRTVVGKVLVDDVSMQVRASEVVAVVGPSGAGKSSFLRLLNRLDEPTGGTVRLDGKDYRKITPRELRRRVG